MIPPQKCKEQAFVKRTEWLRKKGWGGLLLAVLLLTMLSIPSGWRSAHAHGGVVIDSGYTDHFEWLVSIDPYPPLMGDTMLTLLIYDVTNYDPVNDATVVVYLAAPDAPRPCCEPNTHRGPLALVIDPALYPGDYSNPVHFDQPGAWEMQFVVDAGDRSFTVVVPVTINATMGGSQPIAVGEASATPDVAATATVFAQNVAAARAQNSPLAAPNSPLAQPVSPLTNLPTDGAVGALPGSVNDWLLWGALALLPIALIGWWILRSATNSPVPGAAAIEEDAASSGESDD